MDIKKTLFAVLASIAVIGPVQADTFVVEESWGGHLRWPLFLWNLDLKRTARAELYLDAKESLFHDGYGFYARVNFSEQGSNTVFRKMYHHTGKVEIEHGVANNYGTTYLPPRSLDNKSAFFLVEQLYYNGSSSTYSGFGTYRTIIDWDNTNDNPSM